MRLCVKLQLFLNVSALLLATAGAANAQKLRVAYTAFAGTFTILWVGKEAGLYQKHGVDMELLFIGSSTTAVNALLAGDVDIVYSAAGAVVDANLAGGDLMMERRESDGHILMTGPVAYDFEGNLPEHLLV